MKVLRTWRTRSSWGIETRVQAFVDPEEASEICRESLSIEHEGAPNWRVDPTYRGKK